MNKKLAYTILVLSPVLLFSGFIFGKQALFWGLPELQFYPWRALAFEQILEGYVP